MRKRDPIPEALATVDGTTIKAGSTWGPFTATRKCAGAGRLFVRCACGAERSAFARDLVEGTELGCRRCSGRREAVTA